MKSVKISVLIFAFCFCLSILYALTKFGSGVTNADTIVVFLSGVLKWTPFFWWQDRYGMLISGLLSWISDPLLQTFFHIVLYCFTCLMSFFLIAYCFFTSKKWLDFALLGIVFFLTLGPDGETALYLSPWQTYAPAIFLGLLGVVCIEKSFILGLLFLILSQWANFSIIVLIGAVILVRWSGEKRLSWNRNKTKLSFALILAFWAGQVIKKKFGENRITYDFLSFADSFYGVAKFINDFWSSSNYHVAFIVLPPALCFLILLVRRIFNKPMDQIEILTRTYFVFLICIFTYIFSIAANSFAKTSFYPIRYLIPCQFLWVIFWASAVMSSLNLKIKLKDGTKLLIVGVVCAAILCYRFEFPISYDNFKNTMIGRYEKLYQNIEEAKCTHISGDYYRAWPLVYYSKMINSPSQLWALTVRSEVTADQWDLARFESPRVCIFLDDLEEGKRWLKGFSKIDLPIEEKINNLMVYTK